MKENTLSIIKTGFTCTALAIAVIGIRVCLFAPNQIGQIVSLFN